MCFSCHRLLAGFVLVASLLSSCNSPSASGMSDPGSVPLAPTSVKATDTTSRVTISWTAASGTTGCNLYWSTTSGVTKANGTKIAGATSPFGHTGLTNGTTYYYVVAGINATGESIESSQVSATPIAAPTGAIVRFTQEMAETSPTWNLDWNVVAGATSYNVYYSSSSGVTPLNGTKISNAGSGAWQLGAVPQSDYFIVTAVNAEGESAPSPAVTGT
jgi:hypothetical protein